MRPYLAIGLLVFALAAGATAQESGRATTRAAPGERAILLWVDAELSAGRRDHAARGLLRAVKRTPTEPLLTRYAELALPCELPASEREGAKLQRAAGNLLTAMSGARAAPLQPSRELAVAAAWALAITGEPARSRELATSFGSRDDALTVRCLRSSAALLLQRGDRSEAEAILSLARGFAPTDASLARELGLLLLAGGDARRALVPLAERFAIEPGSLTARRDFAYGLLAAGRAAEGYALLAVARDACSQLDDCLIELSRAALEAHQPGEAEQHARSLLQRVSARAPEGIHRHEGSLAALFLIAEAQGQRADASGARATYRRVLELAPDNLRARAALAGLTESVPP